MIVVVGSPIARLDAGRLVADGMPARVAIAASDTGRPVQIVGRIGDDAAADAVLQDLARAGVGHVAILRDPARATPVARTGPEGEPAAEPALDAAPEVDAADIELALRYLTEFRVIVLNEPAARAVTDIVTRATEWGEAALVIADPSPPGAGAPEAQIDVPARAQVMRRGADETESDFAARVAALAVALDIGAVPAD